jgi:hypothetical protein
MHPVGGRCGVEDVIVAEDFTFAASSVMGDDVTGLVFPRATRWTRFRFRALLIADLPWCKRYRARGSAPSG